MVNRIVLVGRLTRDPEQKMTSSGKSVAEFAIAVQKRMKPQDGSPDADFFRVICWDKTAEYVGNYLGKGRLVSVDGRLQSRRYTASDGSNREVVEIVADNVQGLDRPKDDAAPGASTAAPAASSSDDEYDPFAD